MFTSGFRSMSSPSVNKKKRQILLNRKEQLLDLLIEESLSLLLVLGKKLKDVDLSTIHGDFKNVKLSIELTTIICVFTMSVYLVCVDICFSKKKVNSCWSWKGSIFIKIKENYRPTKVGQKSDLYFLFKDFDFF